MAEIRNLEKLVNNLRALTAKAQKDDNASVIVGYTAAYAVHVHENIEMRGQGKPRASGVGVYWGPSGQAKFLEQPARLLGSVLGEIVKTAIKAGKTMAQGLLLAGLRLQRESQLLVPVEYGNLKASAFTRVERGEE